MAFCGKVSRGGIVLAAVLLLLVSIPGWSASIIRDGDPFTIGECLTKPDGAVVTLTAEQVLWRGRSGKSFAIKEWFEKHPAQPRLVAVSTRSLPVKEFWTADVTGTLSTFSGASRDGTAIRQRVLIVSPENVIVYCSANGAPFLFVPLKGTDLPWATKRALTDMAQAGSAAAYLSEGTLPSMPDDPLADPVPDARTGLKYLPDGALLHLLDRVVSASFFGFFYTEEPDRSSAIRVDAEYAYPNPGDLVEISGVMTTSNGERSILVDTEDPTHFVNVISGNCPVPSPLGMTNKCVGGGAAGPHTPAVGSSAGLNNTGLLVTAWGRVTTDVNYAPAGTPYYYIDDGAALEGEPGCTGLRVYDYTRLPAIGDYLTLTGIASADVLPGTSTSIASMWATDYTPSTSGAGTGTLSGTVTADANAAGKVVRVYGTGGMTTFTLDGYGSGNYEVPGVRTGDHTFSADLVGYTRDSAKVTVANGQTTTHNFSLTAAQAKVMASAEPDTIRACTADPASITIFVYHESGTACANAGVALETDLGQFSADTHTQQIQTATDASGAVTVHLWQGNDPPGTAHITVNTTSPTASGSLDVPIVCPVPENVSATGVGSGRIAIYWDVCDEATGYEVYRGTTAGGDKTILTGTAQPSFDGSPKMMFVDQTAADDTRYYYAVKAIYGCGVSELLDEDDAVTNSAAIPWDTRDPAAIVQSASLRTDASANEFIVIGPDGTVYISGSAPLRPWPFDLGPVPVTPAGEEQVLGLGASGYDPCTDKNNAHSGPYRKSESKRGYRKMQALAILPTAPKLTVAPHSFPGGRRIRRGVEVPCPDSGDYPYMYLGGTGWVTGSGGGRVGKYPLDMGLRYEPTDGRWNLFFLRSDHTFWVFDPDENPLYEKFKDTLSDLTRPPARSAWADFATGQTVSMLCWCTKDQVGGQQVKNGVTISITGVDAKTSTTRTMKVFTEQTGFRETGQDVSLKWVTSIGQYFPTLGPGYEDKSDYKRGFVKSGSFARGCGWDSVQVYDMTRSWYLSYSDGIAEPQKTFPTEPAVVTRHGTRWPYYREFDIWVDLTLGQ